MKNLPIFILLCFALIFLPDSLSAQQVMSKNVHKAYNNYADLSNDYIHALWAYRKKMANLNKQLVDYMELEESKRKFRDLTYEHEEFLEELHYYIKPARAYTKAFENGQVLPKEHRTYLNGSIQQMKDVMDRISGLSKRIERFIAEETYRGEKEQKTLFRLLDEGEKYFKDFKDYNERLKSTLGNIEAYYQKPRKDDPYIRHAQQLKSLVDPARDMLFALRQNNIGGVGAAASDLDVAIELIRETESKNINTVRYKGENYGQRGPFVRYDFVIKQAEDIRDYGKQFMNADMSSGEYEPHGPHYYFYNRRVLDKFNRVGRGLVLQYNKYVDSSKVKLVKMVEEPHWFKVKHMDEEDDTVEEPIAVEESKPVTAPEPEEPKSELAGYAANNLVFLLDVSQSMNTPEKLELLKESFKHLLGQMRTEDRVSIVTFAGEAKTVLKPTSSDNTEEIYAALDRLKPSGKSDVERGLRQAYGVLDESMIPGGNNKVIMATDGAFDVYKRIISMIERHASEDKNLTVFFYGKKEIGSVKYRLLQFAEAGAGRYAFIQADNANRIMIEEAQKVRTN